MNFTSLARRALPLSALWFVVSSCGGAETLGASGVGDPPADAGEGRDASYGDAPPEARVALDGAGESLDAANEPWVDAQPAIDAGLFDCQGCLCDGRTHYCEVFHGGAPLTLLDSEAGLCGDASPPYCIPLPASCQGAPTCSCTNDPSWCSCMLVAGGVRVDCYAP